MSTLKFLTKEQKMFYDKNGYITVDVFSADEIANLRRAYEDTFQNKKDEKLDATWKGDWSTEEAVNMEVKSIHGMQMHSAVFTRVLLNERLLDVCEDVMGSANILLHHTKAHLKPPGKGSSFPMHQDYHYFPFKNDSMIAVFISVDKSGPENGGLCVFPGSHLLGPQKDANTTQDSYHYVDQKEFPIEKASPVTLGEGQVLIFSYLLIHGSYFNKSERGRRMLLIQLMSADDVPLADVHKSPCQGLVLRGVNKNRNADITKRLEQ